jgi:hypothetical protein
VKISDFVARGLNNVINDTGEVRNTTNSSIVFPNGWVASILDKNIEPYLKQTKRYSVAVCDYEGYFDWDALIPFGAQKEVEEGYGCFATDDEDEVCRILSAIENLTPAR